MHNKNNKAPFRSDASHPAAPLPVLAGISLVWVQCKEHRCLAYQDEKGKWTNFYTGKPADHFVRVIG